MTDKRKRPGGNSRPSAMASASIDDDIEKSDAWKGGYGYPHGERRGGKWINEYCYKDERGEPYLKVERREGKQFPQYHWVNVSPFVGKSDWKPGAPKGRKIPYFLPELIELGREVPIFITEGEKDTETLVDLGLKATTNSGGAGKWTADLNEHFAGRKTIYVLEDNDIAGRRHAQKVARNLVDIVEEVRIVRFPDVPEGEDVTYWLEHGGTKEDLLARAAAAPLYEKRVRIYLRSGDLHALAREIEEAIIVTQTPILKRAGQMVEPKWDPVRTKDGRELHICKLRTPTWRTLAELISKHAVDFCARDKRFKEEKWVAVDPPPKLIQTLLERGHWKFPTVVGIVNAPTMRKDGSLLTEPGYDEPTQLWYEPAEAITLPDIPERPTPDQAQEALERLKLLVSECHFVSEVDRAVALAAMMTTVLRGAFAVVPLFLFHKPEPGTGASYLTNIIATLATGHEAVPLATSNDNPAEFHKELSAAAAQAQPILHLNNLISNLKSHLLSQMITEGVLDLRVFGKNTETLRCDCRAMTVLANGNNIHVVGELVRRTLTCRLDAKTERPELMRYKNNPIEMIQKNRGRYLADIFMIVRAYRGANSLEAINLSGLEEWAQFVQRPLICLGCEDPVQSQEDARARDPERAAFRERLRMLVNHFGGKGLFTAADVYAKANKMTVSARGMVYENQDLFDAYCDRNGRLRSTTSIGQQLMTDQDRRYGDCHIKVAIKDNKTSNAYRIDGALPADAELVAKEPGRDEELM